MMADPGLVFRHRLALALGRTLADIDNMSQAELASWRVYHRLFVLPDPSHIMGMICSTIVNFAGKSCKEQAAPTDFLPISEVRQAKITADRNKGCAQRMAADAQVRAMNQEIALAVQAARKR